MSEKETLFSKGPPKGVKRLFFRFPLLLYKAGLGPLLGERFLKLTHTGRALIISLRVGGGNPIGISIY